VCVRIEFDPIKDRTKEVAKLRLPFSYPQSSSALSANTVLLPRDLCDLHGRRVVLLPRQDALLDHGLLPFEFIGLARREMVRVPERLGAS